MRASRGKLAHARLQLGEARERAVEGDHFAVDDEIRGRLRCYGCGDLRVSGVDDLLVSRKQPDLATMPESEHAFTIELALENPLRAGERLIGKRRQHGRHPARMAPAMQPPPQLRLQPIGQTRVNPR